LQRHRSLLVVLLLVLTLLTASVSAAAATEIVFVHTNDFHARMEAFDFEGGPRGGIARLAGMVNVIRGLYPGRVLWLDAGDTTHGTTVANLFYGASVVDALNKAGLDVMAPGNHDYNYGHDVLLLRAQEAEFPILAANVFFKDTGEPFLPPYTFFELDGVRIAVIGFSPMSTPVTTHPKNVAALHFEDALAVAAELVPQLREQADLVVVLSHLGYEDDVLLAKAVPGIDVIVGGHSHTKLDEPVVVGDTIIVQANEYGKYLGFLKLVVEDGKIIAYEGRLIPTTADMPISQEIADVLAGWQVQLTEKLGTVIGETLVDLNGERSAVRTRETNLGNLIADIMRITIDADVAIQNGGGIRASIPAGPITLGDVYTVLPFDNTLAGIELTGAQLLAALEHGVSNWPAEWGGFPQVSGLTFTFNPNKPVGQRIVSVTVNGEPLDPNKVYRVATNDFMAAGGDSYTMMVGAPFFHGSERGDGYFLRDVVAAYLEENPVVAPQVEGRIIIVEE